MQASEGLRVHCKVQITFRDEVKVQMLIVDAHMMGICAVQGAEAQGLWNVQ